MTDRRGQARERIIRAAERSLVEHGYAGTTARSIAAAGGFAPGFIYYHFADLDELLVAVAVHSSGERVARYRAEVTGVAGAVDLVRRLRLLYDEDVASGHLEVVQELMSAARPGSPLAAALAAQTREWEALGEQVITELLPGTALARLFAVPVLARAVVAYYLGMQTLTYLDGDTGRPEAAFRQAVRLAAAFDRLPRSRRRARGPAPASGMAPPTAHPADARVRGTS
ncbi:MAG TPA: TetR/AcrR family transcriptional regulator [Pseudonocardiaceae bacterium]